MLVRPLLVFALSAALATVLCGGDASSEARPIIALRNDEWTIPIEPGSLEVTAQPASGEAVSISAPQQGLGSLVGLRQNDQEVSWEFEQQHVRVSLRLDGRRLHAHFVAAEPGRFTWPVAVGDSAVRAYLLPLYEGSYVPADDAEWLDFLVSRGPGSATETLSMPF